MGIKASDDAYKIHPYEELSKEFQEKWPTAVRAFELVPLMYNRLTLVDGYSHKAAIKKMRDDHDHLPGFSTRNIRRYLPEDNPSVPTRIRTSRPKTSIAKNSNEQELSDNNNTDDLADNAEYGESESVMRTSSEGQGDKSEPSRRGHEGHKEELHSIVNNNDEGHEQSYEQLLEQNRELRDKLQDVKEKYEKEKAKSTKLTKALSQASFTAANDLAKDSSKQKKRRDDQEKSLKPFECNATLELEGRLVPLVVYCNPAKKTVRVELDR
jgi:hypothetical protein